MSAPDASVYGGLLYPKSVRNQCAFDAKDISKTETVCFSLWPVRLKPSCLTHI